MYTTSTSIQEFVLIVMAVVVIVLFLWAIYAFLVSIFQFIFSRWESEKIKKAWNNIRYMILWIILSLFLLFVFPMILQFLEIQWYEEYTAQNIFDKASELIERIISREDVPSTTRGTWSPNL